MTSTLSPFFVARRLFAYSKATLLYSLEGLTDEDLTWQPKPGFCSIGWHAGHIGAFRGALMWFFDPEPEWSSLGCFLPFGYGSDPDATLTSIPSWAELVPSIHEDWRLFKARFEDFRLADFNQLVPLNNPDGETLFEMCHRTSWHADIHIGQICAVRDLLDKSIFPRPPFGSVLRRAGSSPSTTGWERIIASVDET